MQKIIERRIAVAGLGFEIDASGDVFAQAANQRVLLQSDLVALWRLGDQEHAYVAKDPRVLLLYEGQQPLDGSKAANEPPADQGVYLPTRQEGDIVAYLEPGELSEPGIARAIIQAMVRERWAGLYKKGRRTSLGAMAVGAAFAVAGELEAHDPKMTLVGACMFLIGGVGLRYFRRDGAPIVRTSEHTEKPVRLRQRVAE